MTSRKLNDAQVRALDRLYDRDPAARVIGWDPIASGPIVRRSFGTFQVIAQTGRIRIY